jgi:hypothetical protein
LSKGSGFRQKKAEEAITRNKKAHWSLQSSLPHRVQGEGTFVLF